MRVCAHAMAHAPLAPSPISIIHASSPASPCDGRRNSWFMAHDMRCVVEMTGKPRFASARYSRSSSPATETTMAPAGAAFSGSRSWRRRRPRSARWRASRARAAPAWRSSSGGRSGRRSTCRPARARATGRRRSSTVGVGGVGTSGSGERVHVRVTCVSRAPRARDGDVREPGAACAGRLSTCWP